MKVCVAKTTEREQVVCCVGSNCRILKEKQNKICREIVLGFHGNVLVAGRLQE